METTNIYLFKALDAYPYNLQEAVESLNYALSYDPENTQALFLMAKIHAYQLEDYEAAKHYFEATIASNMDLATIYPDYAYALVRNEDYEEAQKLLDHAMKVKASDKPWLYWTQGQLFESQGSFKQALKAFKEAKKASTNSFYASFFEGELKRVKGKLPKKKKKAKSTRKKKNKRKKSKNKKKKGGK